MGANNYDFNSFDRLFQPAIFLSDKDGQRYNLDKRMQRAKSYGGSRPRSERFWWHTQPKPPEVGMENGVEVTNPQAYTIHASEKHIKTLTNGQPVSSFEKPVGPTYLHHSPPAAFEDIKKNGLKPAITAWAGEDSKRFGVFLTRDNSAVDSSGAPSSGSHDVWEVNVPKEDLRNGPDGDLYVERTIRPSEIRHVGHKHLGENHLGIQALAPGRAENCPTCSLGNRK